MFLNVSKLIYTEQLLNFIDFQQSQDSIHIGMWADVE